MSELIKELLELNLREFKDTNGQVEPNLYYFFDLIGEKILGHYNFSHSESASESLSLWLKQTPKEFQGKSVQVKKGSWLIQKGYTEHDQTTLSKKK